MRAIKSGRTRQMQLPLALGASFFGMAGRPGGDGDEWRARHGPTGHVDGAARLEARGRPVARRRTPGRGPATGQLETADVAPSGRAEGRAGLNGVARSTRRM